MKNNNISEREKRHLIAGLFAKEIFAPKYWIITRGSPKPKKTK